MERPPVTRFPDFVIIGAMKCATSTLHDQLAAQPGFVMSDPKEPYFFSDDPVWAKGLDWYTSLFADAGPDDLCGESTTHYTKLPTYPKTIERMVEHVPNARLIYVMRHPIDRLVSQYIHQWTEREITVPIDEAIDAHEELIAYSRYAMQLEPFFAHWDPSMILPVFFDRLRTHSQAELDRVCAFLDYDGNPEWADLASSNVSAQRLRKSPLRDAIIDAPGLSHLRRLLVPQAVRDRVKKGWQMTERPELSAASVERLTELFDDELRTLSAWLGTELTCANWAEVTRDEALEWAEDGWSSRAA